MKKPLVIMQAVFFEFLIALKILNYSVTSLIKLFIKSHEISAGAHNKFGLKFLRGIKCPEQLYL